MTLNLVRQLFFISSPLPHQVTQELITVSERSQSCLYQLPLCLYSWYVFLVGKNILLGAGELVPTLSPRQLWVFLVNRGVFLGASYRLQGIGVHSPAEAAWIFIDGSIFLGAPSGC